MAEIKDLSEVRRRRIAELTEERGAVAIHELCRELNRSEATIRRDIRELGERGQIIRTRGGAMARKGAADDLSNEARKQVGSEDKRRIARAAIELVEGTEVVFLDAGTTALCVADLAGEVPEVRFVTTGLAIARRLGEQGHRNFYLIGGRYLPVNDSFVGSLAIAGLRSLHFDIALLCCSAVNVERGCVEIGDESYAQIQKEAVAASDSIQVLADHRKFETHAFVRTAPFSALDGIITTARTGEKNAALMRSAGMKVTLV